MRKTSKETEYERETRRQTQRNNGTEIITRNGRWMRNNNSYDFKKYYFDFNFVRNLFLAHTGKFPVPYYFK